ncbi:hypothetical protein CMV_027601 [Castanea mollissima]|uniref:Secreted protein n=1 Tax=Castanea mollissima TaxID=60419 RepID=A0A8J4Q6C7_9ROSI|nr:hypothetical protein CMV_027601 [Castanea mollissima]
MLLFLQLFVFLTLCLQYLSYQEIQWFVYDGSMKCVLSAILVGDSPPTLLERVVLSWTWFQVGCPVYQGFSGKVLFGIVNWKMLKILE